MLDTYDIAIVIDALIQITYGWLDYGILGLVEPNSTLTYDLYTLVYYYQSLCTSSSYL